MNTTHALVGVGANLGMAVAQVRAAMDAVAAIADDPARVRCSSLWRSPPVDCPPGSPDFVNAVVRLPVPDAVDPHGLLQRLQHIELAAGRVRSVRNAPRVLDLDLLLFGDEEVRTSKLEVPHPRGHLRAFVLRPAAQVDPDRIWPGLGRTIQALVAQLPSDDDVVCMDGREALDPDSGACTE